MARTRPAILACGLHKAQPQEHSELTGITAAATTGLDPTDMTVFNNEVLFNGVDAASLSGLWVTNGTVAGTQELVAGAPRTSD